MGRAVPASKTRDERLTGKGPKRILAIDAGGPRIVLAAALLGALEAKLRREKNDPDLRLWDHFDLIGGVSAGAFLAAAFCAGASVDEACGLLEDAGPAPGAPLPGDAVRRPKFAATRLAQTLEEAFGDAAIGDPRIRAGFAALVKPLEDDPPEVWTNAPGSASADKTFKEAILASLGGDCSFDGRRGFADAALAAPSPVWPLLRFAISPRGLAWPSGANKLHVVSVGAGRLRPWMPGRVFDGPIDPNPAAVAANVATRAGYALEAALFDAAEEALAALAELSTPEGTSRSGALLSFTRFDVDLSADALTGLGFSPGEIQTATERRPASAEAVALWRRIGARAGEAILGVAPSPSPSVPAEEQLVRVAPEQPAEQPPEQRPEPHSEPSRETAAQEAQADATAPIAADGAKRPLAVRRPRSRLEALSGVLGGRGAPSESRRRGD